MSHYVGAGAAAEHLGVCLSTLRCWRTEHGLPHYVTPSGSVRYDLDELDAWMKRFKVRSTLLRRAKVVHPELRPRLRRWADAI